MTATALAGLLWQGYIKVYFQQARAEDNSTTPHGV